MKASVDDVRRLVASDRFRSKISVQGDCWIWTGGLTRSGYGVIQLRNQCLRAHRVALAAKIGRLDFDQTDHLCRNRACVNPDHLEPVSARENVRRGLACNDLTGVCRSGAHSWTTENIRVRQDGTRECRPCAIERDNERRRERRRLARVTR